MGEVMTSVPDIAISAEFSVQAGNEKFNELIYSLQRARLDLRNNATLTDLLAGRNPYHLRATRPVAFQLVKYCLDNHLLAADELLFNEFLRDLADCSVSHGWRLAEPEALLECFAQDDLPLISELPDAKNRASNRLTYQFLADFCDEDGRIAWERLTEFVSRSESDKPLRELASTQPKQRTVP